MNINSFVMFLADILFFWSKISKPTEDNCILFQMSNVLQNVRELNSPSLSKNKFKLECVNVECFLLFCIVNLASLCVGNKNKEKVKSGAFLKKSKPRQRLP